MSVESFSIIFFIEICTMGRGERETNESKHICTSISGYACIAILEIIKLYILGEKIKYKYVSPMYMYLYLNLATHY